MTWYNNFITDSIFRVQERFIDESAAQTLSERSGALSINARTANKLFKKRKVPNLFAVLC